MFRKLALLVASSLFFLGGSTSAQCATGPDGLSGPCHNLVPLNIPGFPVLTLPSTMICWNNCNPTQLCANIVLNPPAPVTCDSFSAAISVTDCGGLPLLGGTLALDYTRTWEEFNVVTLQRHQVYRFVAKVDLSALVPPTTCVVPPCFSTYANNFYYGYVDYAIDCTSGLVEASIVLFHNCDQFIHHPLSTTPGTFHANTSYAIVGPSTGANPFVASNTSAPVGAISGEAVRLTDFAGACVTEDPLGSGQLNFLGSGCGCPFTPAPPQLSARRIRGDGTCSDPVGNTSSFQSVNTMSNFPWFHDMANSIGSWTTSASYPGQETVWVDEVPMFFRDVCSDAFGLPDAFGEVYYGATTAFGNFPSSGGATINDKFVDLASNTSWSVPGPAPSTFMGSVLPTRNLIYLNVP